jgi:phosphatidylglycerophosphate synthase
MQVVIVAPEASAVDMEPNARLTRQVCGIGLLERTILTAQRAGATEVLLVWPMSLPIELAVIVMQSSRVQKNNNLRLLAVDRFDPDQARSWPALQSELESRFVWLPWNWVTNARLLANLPDWGQVPTNWAVPAWVSKSTVALGLVFQPQPKPLPEGIAVTSDETAAAAERFLVARSGKVSDGIHSSFNRRLCRPAVRWLSHTPVTPNAVTFGGVIVSIFAAIAFARGTYWSYVFGALLFFGAGLFDEIDGMLARIKFADSPFGTYLESFGDSLSYVLLFGGMTVGLYRQHGVRELWVGGALLIGTVLALVVTTLQRKRAASPDRPTEYLGNFYRKLEQDSSNWISRAVRQAQGFQRRGIMIHYIVIFAVLGGVPAIFYLATLGSHLTWTLALYYNHRFFKQAPTRISLNEIHASQEAS